MRNLLLIFLVGCGENHLMNPVFPDMSTIQAEPGALGAPCTSSSQCNFGVCLAIGRCSHTCPLPACEVGWTCAPEAGQSAPVCQCPTIAAETCNGIDDDCNGIADDNAVCPGGGACVKGQCVCTTPTGGFHAQFVAKQINLPHQRSEFAVDLNGDGKTDNQYGNIVAALSAQMLDPQDNVDARVAKGDLLLLVDLQSSDSIFSSDSCAGAKVTSAKPQANPSFLGSDHFTVDNSVTPGNFRGPLVSSQFTSESPVIATMPVSLEVYLPLFSVDPTSAIPKVPLTAAQLRLNRLTGSGQVNGVIKKKDLDNAMANVAAILDDQVTANPASSTTAQILSIFDTGGAASVGCGQTCQNPDGTCAVKNDKHISACEVMTNSIIKNLLAPDLDMFDAAGNYAPNAANTDKDSLSVGFGIQAIGAQF